MSQREIKFRAIFEGKVYDVQTRSAVRPNHKGYYKQHGYVKRLVTEHPFADKRGYVMEHRLVVEENLSSFLPKHVVIHHKNGVRDDNRLENLEIIQEQARHAKHHDTGERNPNGRFVASDPIFSEIKFRLLNKNTNLVQVFTLSKLIGTTFRNGQFEFRGRFTGLKDKNGVEIYEGDIVRNRGYSELCIVERYQGQYIGRYNPLTPHYQLDESKKISECGDLCYIGLGFYAIERNSLEVVGNIYENADLLETVGEPK